MHVRGSAAVLAVRTCQRPCAFGRAELTLLVLASTDFSCSQLSEDVVLSGERMSSKSDWYPSLAPIVKILVHKGDVCSKELCFWKCSSGPAHWGEHTFKYTQNNTVPLRARLLLQNGSPVLPLTLKPSNFALRITECLLFCTHVFVSAYISSKWLLIPSFRSWQLKFCPHCWACWACD